MCWHRRALHHPLREVRQALTSLRYRSGVWHKYRWTKALSATSSAHLPGSHCHPVLLSNVFSPAVIKLVYTTCSFGNFIFNVKAYIVIPMMT